MKYLPCSCPVCQGHNLAELMESQQRTRLLAMHNLYVSLQEIKQVKQCISEGSLWDLLETRCRSHPRLLDGLKKLGQEGQWLEGLDSSSKSTFFYLSPQSSSRPETVRYAHRLERFTLEGDVLICDDPGSDTAGFDHVLYFKPPFGPYPAELSETYPFNAEVPEIPDDTAITQAKRNMKRLIEANPKAKFSIRLRSLPEGQREI